MIVEKRQETHTDPYKWVRKRLTSKMAIVYGSMVWFLRIRETILPEIALVARRCPSFVVKTFECPQMWVWPQVPLGGPPPPPPYDLAPLPHTSLGHPLPLHCRKKPGGGGKREGKGGEGRAVAWGKGPPVAMGDGGDLPRGVWAGPTSGGSRDVAKGSGPWKVPHSI